jgi:hypothetical protein
LNPSNQRSESNPDSKFELFSDRKVRKFANYDLIDFKQLRPNAKTPVINFDHLKELLLSKDFSRQGEYHDLIKDLKFLDKKSEMIGNRVAFTTYPRVGNSFLRSVIEKVTGVFTGSDMLLKVTVG